MLDRKEFLVSAITLALERSALAQTAGMEALGARVSDLFGRMYTGSTLDLGPLWEALSAEAPPADLAPPLLALKSWEGVLGLLVELPPEVETLPAPVRQEALRRIGVGPAEILKTISARLPRQRTPTRPLRVEEVLAKAARSGGFRPHTGEHQAAKVETAEPPAPAAAGPGVRMRVATLIVLGALLGTGAVLGWRTLFPSIDARPVDAASLRAILPLEAPEQRGPYLYAVLADSEWAGRTDEDRKSRLRRLQEEMAPSGVRFIALRDRAGKVMALLVHGRPPRIYHGKK